MDPATLAGVALGLIAIIATLVIEGGSIGSILLPAPLILIFVGSFACGLAGGLLKDALGSLNALQKALMGKVTPADETIDVVVKLAERARREGLLALEDAARDVEDPFLKRGLELAIDGTDPEELRDILESEVDAKRAADKVHYGFFNDLGGYSPTIGIVGAVIGLIHALENLDKPEQLGHLIAAAFVATLWGLVAANVMFLPIGKKLKRTSELELAQMELVLQGIMAIQSGANPRVVSQKLTSLLPPDVRAAAEAAKAA
jgi:chemotaxis protein MotA